MRVKRLILSIAAGLILGVWPSTAQTSGSGFVVTEDGYIVTCAHVIRNARKVEVVLGDRLFDAEVVEVDGVFDFALLKVKAAGLAPLPLAESEEVEVGEEVRAFGFPLATVLGETVKITRGTISGIETKERYKYFQVDAVLNPGNSGGPLVNNRAEVIAINNAKLGGPAVTGIGLAVPVDYIKDLLRRKLIAFTTVTAPPQLDGPGIVRRVAPSVALVNVTMRAAAINTGAPPPTRIAPPEPLELVPTLAKYEKLVNALTYSPDGRILASGAGDGLVGLWDARSGELKRPLVLHKSAVTTVAFSADGRWLASGSHDQTVQLWDPASGELRRTLAWNGGPVYAVALSPTAEMLAAASGPPGKAGFVRLWEVGSGKMRRNLTGHRTEVTAVAFSPDGQLLASASKDRTVRIWDARTGKLLQVLKGHFGEVNTVAFSPASDVVASAGRDFTVRLTDPRTGDPIRTLTGHTDEVEVVVFSGDGMELATASLDNTVKVWKVATGELLRTIEGPGQGVTALAWSPDGRHLAVAGRNKKVELLDLNAARPAADSPAE